MKYVENSEVYAEVGFFRSIWLRARLAFSQKARDELEDVRATLVYAEKLRDIKHIREKAEAHQTLMQEIEAAQPEVVVMEGSIAEYEKAVDNHGSIAEFSTHTVEYDPKALDELYDPDELDRRIAKETDEITNLVRREKFNKC